MKDHFFEAVNLPHKTFELPFKVEARVCSLNPVAVTDDYISKFFLVVDDDLKAKLQSKAFNKVSLNLKISFSRVYVCVYAGKWPLFCVAKNLRCDSCHSQRL